MNYRYGRIEFFPGNESKSDFLDYLNDGVTEMKRNVFAYCLLDNHSNSIFNWLPE